MAPGGATVEGLVSKQSLRDPLGISRVVSALDAELAEAGLKVEFLNDLVSFGSAKQAMRDEAPSPFFDGTINEQGDGRFFWMLLTASDGRKVGMQAFRLDTINSSLADWGPSYTIGLYMRRQEVLVPMHPSPPRGTIAERISGRVVYHGELWIDRTIRNRRVVEVFGRLGMLLALLRWNPDAIWALASQSMATHGHLNRMGFTYLERGFFRWQWGGDGIDNVEWVAIAERSALEAMVEEMLTTPQHARQA
jgi:hypothetical protein